MRLCCYINFCLSEIRFKQLCAYANFSVKLLANIVKVILVESRGWINTSLCCNVLTTTHHVSGITVHVHT